MALYIEMRVKMESNILNIKSSGLEDYYWYWYCNIPRLGAVKLRRLLAVLKSPEQVYKAEASLLKEAGKLTDKEISSIEESKKDTSVYREFMDIKKKGIHFTYPGKEDYPDRLMHIYDYPLCLYYYGKLPDDDVPTVAIVGSRQNTTYGYNIAEAFAKSFANMGIQVISGLARGIDGASHKGAMDGGGYTCGVLGCGIDICYPRENIGLFTAMKASGGIVSEYSLGTAPHPGQFPVRNRIISGLSDVVIVVEARKKSGSLITVDSALEQNKEVMVVPGRIGDSLSEGCNELIKLGAAIITSPKDILDIEAIRSKIDNKKRIIDESTRKFTKYAKSGIENAKNPENTLTDICNKNKDGIPEYQQNKGSVQEFKLATKKNMLYSCVDLYPVGLNELIERTGLSLQEISSALVELELEGKIEEVAGNCYARKYS